MSHGSSGILPKSSRSSGSSGSCGPVLLGALAFALALPVAGCGHNSPPPVDARRVHVGQGAIHARAHGDGVIWVQDDTDGKVIWTGPVHRGDAIDVNAVPGVEGTLTVAGEVKARKGIDPGHSYSVYQKP